MPAYPSVSDRKFIFVNSDADGAGGQKERDSESKWMSGCRSFFCLLAFCSGSRRRFEKKNT